MTERDDRLKVAVKEAETFIEKANALLSRRKDLIFTYTPRESGACRRASMDLTRALADYRKGIE